MNCGDCRELISDFLDGQLHGSVKREFEEHSRTCEDCASALRGVRAVRTRLAELPRHQLPDAFGFRIKRMLAEEAEREQSWLRRVREWLSPKPETAWAAASGTVAALASVALVWMIWMPGSNQQSPSAVTKSIAGATERPESRSVRYVLEQLPSRGDLIESIAIADSASRRTISSSSVRAQPVSADF